MQASHLLLPMLSALASRRCPRCAGAGMLALFASVAPAQEAPDTPTRTVHIEGPVDLPIQMAGTHVVVDGVRVNGEGPLRFLVDTGAQGAGRVDSALAERLGLEPVDEVLGGDGTGRPGRAMPVYRLDSLELAGLRAEGVRVLSRDYNPPAAVAARGGRIDGILGIDLFAELLLTIDYPAQRLRLERGALPEPDGREVLALEPNSPVPAFTIELAGTTQHAYIDTGAMGPASLPGALADALPLLGEPRVVGRARTVSGEFELRAATLDGELAIGRHVLFQPEVMFGGPLQDAVLGADVLRDYALTVDQANNRVRFLHGGRAAHASAPERTRLPVAEARVPLPTVNGRPVIEAKIGDAGPFRFVLDTGASRAVLHAGLARELGLESLGETPIGVPGSETRLPAKEHVLATVSVGPATFRGVPAYSLDDPIMNLLGNVQGIVGLPLFHDLLVTLDPSANELVLAHGFLDATAIPYRLDADGLPEFEIKLAGQPLRAHLDTGNPGKLTIPSRAAQELPFVHEPRVIGHARTVSGEFELRGAPLEGSAHVLGMQLDGPMVVLHDWNDYANIGGGLIAGRAMTFDQRGRRFALGETEGAAAQPQRVVQRGGENRKSYGLMLAMTSSGPIGLQGVVPGSVAEEAGLLAGDTIVGLNGVDVDELDLEARGAAFRASTLGLTVEREDERLHFELSHERP